MSDNCAACGGTGKTPSGFDMAGNNAHPMRVKTGPCPLCSGGSVCPWCLYSHRMGADEIGKATCGCGWGTAGKYWKRGVIAAWEGRWDDERDSIAKG